MRMFYSVKCLFTCTDLGERRGLFYISKLGHHNPNSSKAYLFQELHYSLISIQIMSYIYCLTVLQ